MGGSHTTLSLIMNTANRSVVFFVSSPSQSYQVELKQATVGFGVAVWFMTFDCLPLKHGAEGLYTLY